MSEQSIKVLSVCTSDVGGGASRAACRIHRAVQELGVDSRMLVKNKYSKDSSVISLEEFIPTNPLYKAFEWTCNKVKNKLQHFRWNRYPEREQIFLSDLRGTDLHDALQKLDFDILHLHWINQRFISLEDLPKDKPIVWTLHDSWPFCGVCHYFLDCEEYKRQCGCCPYLHSNNAKDLSHRVWKKKEEVYKGLNLHIVTPSRWLGNCAKQSSLLGGFPVMVIPNCLDVNTFRPLDETEVSPKWQGFQEKKSEKPFVLYGAVNAATDKIKGFANLLSALRILEEQGHADDFELIVFGATESEVSVDVNIPIHYVGYISETQDLVSLYNLASVMVVPSLTENLSYAIMESLSCGTPVVAFNIGGNSDMVEHKQNGYLARECDNADLAAGIVWCLENNVNKGLGIAAREKVMNGYVPEVVGKSYIDLYYSVL